MSQTNTTQDLIVKDVETSVNELATHFLNYPYFFYTENDIHCHLFNLIFHKFEFHRLNKPITTSDGKTSILLHKEYPTKAQYMRSKESGELQKVEKGTRGHFDLSIWNPDLVSEKMFRSKGGSGEQETFIAIELALMENKDNANQVLTHTKNDLLKLSDLKNNVKHGFMLLFVRDWDNRNEFKKLAKKQLILKEKPKSLYIENSNDLEVVRYHTRSSCDAVSDLGLKDKPAAVLMEKGEVKARIELTGDDVKDASNLTKMVFEKKDTGTCKANFVVDGKGWTLTPESSEQCSDAISKIEEQGPATKKYLKRHIQ